MKSKVYTKIIFLLAFGFNSFAQQKQFELKNFTQENGLPSNESYFVYRDSRDFLWMATDQGVVRYNGNKMEYFDLPDNVIFKIREDSKGRVWFFSHTGKLAYFYKGAIHSYQYNDNISKTFKSIIISNAYVNDKDDIIINSAPQNFKISKSGIIEKSDYMTSNKKNSCIFRITPISENQYFTQLVSTNYFNSDIAYIKVTAKGRNILYKVSITPGIYTQYGCVTANGKDFFFFYGKTIIKLNADGSFKTKKFPSVITSLELDKNIWVGFIKNGTVLLDSGLNVIYRDPTLNDKSVTSIRSDYEGGTWFSTLEKGIYYLKSPFISHLIGDSSLTQPIFRFFKTGDSSMLFANAKGIYKLFHNFISPVLLQNYKKVTDLFTDTKKNIFISGIADSKVCNLNENFGEYKKSSDKSHPISFFLNSVSEVVNPAENKYLMNTYTAIWMFVRDTHLANYENSNCLSMHSFDSAISKPGILFFDAKKQLWMGSINALYKFNSMSSPPIQFRPHDTLFKKGVTCMRQMENGIYVIGVRFGGIVLMLDTTVIVNITENEGLLSNSIKYLLPLKNKLWVATAKGISVIRFQSYDPRKYKITNIGKNEGLYNIIINQLMPYQKNIIAATSNGIYEIDNTEQFLNNMQKPIPFYINSVSYYKGDTSEISEITLPFKNNRVAIRYSAVCFNLPDEIKYYYRFDNSDTNWHEIASTELLMENLIPGTYNLEIKASITAEQRFSEIQKLQIIVEKPWWQNNWLRITGIILLLGTIFLFYKRRINMITHREQQNTALNIKMIELEQTALRSQMNPHFIFNCLTSIQQLVVIGNKTEANEYLVRFARLIRKTLELSGRPFITIEEEIDYLSEYLILEQLRIPGQFEFSINIDSNIDIQKTEIPNMMLQPIIENCIRHGIKHLDNQKGYIKVLLEQKDKYIFCSITDNGIGRLKLRETNSVLFSENKSYGIDIVNKRLEAISFQSKNESMLEVEDLYNTDGSAAGTKVIMRLPFKPGKL